MFRGGGRGEVVNIVEYGMFRFVVVVVQGCAPGSKVLVHTGRRSVVDIQKVF